MRKTKLTDFGKAVHKRMIDRNMTLSELAQAVGTSSVYLCNILRGKKKAGKYSDRIIKILEMDKTS